MKKVICALCTGAAMLGLAPAARADNMPGSPDKGLPATFTPSFGASRVGASLDLWPGKDSFATTLGAELSLRVARQVFLDMSYAGAFVGIHRGLDKGDYMSFGNPTLGVHFTGAAAPNLHLYVGGGVTIPVLQDPGPGISTAAFFGERIRGYHDADRFVRGHMAVRAAGGLEWNIAGPMLLRAEVRPVVYIPVNDKHPVLSSTHAGMLETGGDTGVMIEQALELEARANMGLGIGARLQSVLMPTEADVMQTVVEPFIALTPRRGGFFMRAGVPIALDPDLGFGMGQGKLIGARIDLGAQW